MTKIVRDYITDKIKEGTMAKLVELNKKVDATLRKVDRDEAQKMVAGLPEYKALQKAVAKAMNDKFGVKVTKVNIPSTCYWVEWENPRWLEATAERDEFVVRRDRAIRDALVELELSKSKADVDELITKAVAAISKAK